MADVGLLHNGDAGIVAQAVVELRLADVDGVDAVCAVLEEAVGEAAGGGADVGGGETGYFEVECGECVF